MAHLRLNFLFDEDPSLETFIQYSKNPFRKFNKRELVGLGARFNLENNFKAGNKITLSCKFKATK